jgi:hypothetical protein
VIGPSSIHATSRKPLSALSQAQIRFQLALFWSTNSKSLILKS